MHPKILIALALSAFALANPLPEPHWQHKEQNKNKHIEGNKNPEENKQVDAWSAARGRIATFFYQKGNPGACGTVHADWDHVVALYTSDFEGGKHCWKRIEITDTRTGNTAEGVVADMCPTCKGPGSIDLSTGLFDVFARPLDGIFPVTWRYI